MPLIPVAPAPTQPLPTVPVLPQPVPSDMPTTTPGSSRSGIREVPKLGSMVSLASFWRAWKVGDPVRGMDPLERMQDKDHRPAGFNRQRFSELSKIAKEILRLAKEKKLTEQEVVKLLDTQRDAQTVNQFVKQFVRGKCTSLLA